ncbi:spore coat CotO family protein [Bacillus safensis]|uniref:spore coat CotO family protein n=1 Tax=Bacillus safensis TaxID=561879 RepID=UPI002238D00B|nr:spore coat CotO family protein [Bacillus safensis]MCW4644610.1 spore coat CotO family protein [Bacillus safensis]MCY7564378.1 spore coat CotO family protein [Bacillus safensis]MCY7625337.1 spore coat CotO family protein [Bacillus safensis]MCY7633690.1 spore coat CotO family protein [Bacillus safensis]MCY7650281.1 spore coat CotO family protein [Bacillus safensis]
MSNKGDENQKPLMYIVQPSYHESKPAMQNIVRKRKKSEKQPESDTTAQDVIEKSKQEEPAAQEIEHKKEAEPPKLQHERDMTQEAELTEEQEITQEAELTEEQEITQEAELAQEQEATQEAELIQKRESQEEERNQPEGVFYETKEEPRRKRVKKPLSQMSIDEKVDFLTRLPHNMPRALCLIEADGKTYRGIIMDRKDDTVIIRTAGGGNPVELAIAEISSIHPLGF